MDFYKKLKTNKPSSNEVLVTNNIISEVERKFMDMQPVIQGPTSNKSEVQKTIMEIKNHVDSLKDLGGSVTPEQQDRIRDITRKYKEISVKHGHISDISAKPPSSPRPFRKKLPEISKETTQLPQNNPVFKQEVEETLKVMRQKRLDRLSVFVAEQSKLSEERSHKNKDSDEIEDAIKSIQKTDIEKTSLRSIVDGNLRQHKAIREEAEEEKQSPRLGRSRSNESTDKFKNSKSSTLKLINKLNCTVPLSSSNEDLTEDVYNKVASASKTDDSSYSHSNVSQYIDEAHLDHSNVLLSPRGKQRKAIYMYEHECQFLENEKRSSLPSLTTFGKETTQGDVSKKDDLKKKIHTYENRDIIIKNRSLVKLQTEKLPDEDNTVWENTYVRTKINHIYENSDIIANRSSIKSRNSLETSSKIDENEILLNTSLEGNKSEPIGKTTPSDSRRLPKLNVKGELNSRKKFNRVEPPRSPLKSPLPLPRRNNYAERILKKVQRNWETLDEVIENDSDIDGDEVEDLKRTWEEANILLNEYKTRINRLDRKSKEEAMMEKLNDINAQLVTVEEEIGTFKGLKRDSSYMQLSSRLSNYFLEVSKMTFSPNGTVSKKQNTLDEIDSLIKRLENRVNKNEAMLMEILDMQVRSIGTNFLCITKV